MRHYITTKPQIKALAKAIAGADMISADVETTGLNPYAGDIVVGLGVYVDGNSYYVPIAHGEGRLTTLTFEDVKDKRKSTNDWKAVETQRQFDLNFRAGVREDNVPDAWLDLLRDVWHLPKHIIFHNATFDLTFLQHAGFPDPQNVLDTRVACHVLFSDWHSCMFKMPDTKGYEKGNQRLKWQARLHGLVSKGDFGVTGNEKELHEAINDLQNQLTSQAIGLDDKKHMWMLHPKDVFPYACQDVEITWHLHEKHLGLLEKWNNLQFYYDQCAVQHRVVWRMMRTGFRLDEETALAMVEKGQQEQANILVQIEDLTGIPGFNPNSPKQIKDYLHSIGIMVQSTNALTLAPYASKVLLILLIQRFKRITKLLGTYVVKWGKRALNEGDVLHPDFNITGTKTYRWSSKDFQQVPREVDDYLSPKNLLCPVKPGWVMFEVDFSALEVCGVAWVADSLIGKGEDMTLTNEIEAGTDMHAWTRDKMDVVSIMLHGKDATPDNVAVYYESKSKKRSSFDSDETMVAQFMKDMRYIAKQANFACQYGGGKRALNGAVGNTLDESTAMVLVSALRDAFPTKTMALHQLKAMFLQNRPAPDGAGAFKYLQGPIFGQTYKLDYYDPALKRSNGRIDDMQEENARDGLSRIVQGTCSLINAHSVLRVCDAFSEDTVDIHAQIHDSLIGSCHPDDLPDVARTITKLMIDWPVQPALSVEFEVCPPDEAWGRKQHYDPMEV